tara:strand:- start:1054 stop:1434 length:381 start_codon:yes stop_codon:yes gene_type:complete
MAIAQITPQAVEAAHAAASGLSSGELIGVVVFSILTLGGLLGWFLKRSIGAMDKTAEAVSGMPMAVSEAIGKVGKEFQTALADQNRTHAEERREMTAQLREQTEKIIDIAQSCRTPQPNGADPHPH